MVSYRLDYRPSTVLQQNSTMVNATIVKIDHDQIVRERERERAMFCTLTTLRNGARRTFFDASVYHERENRN